MSRIARSLKMLLHLHRYLHKLHQFYSVSFLRITVKEKETLNEFKPLLKNCLWGPKKISGDFHCFPPFLLDPLEFTKTEHINIRTFCAVQ